jgi:hypothetical protein
MTEGIEVEAGGIMEVVAEVIVKVVANAIDEIEAAG